MFLLAAAVYAGTLGHELVWDDPALKTLVGARARHGGIPALLGSEFLLEEERHTGFYRPVVLLSLWLDGSVFSWSPAALHAHNILLHGAASVLVRALLLAAGASGAGALAGAVLFAVHPAHVESVAFVSGRTDLLCAVFLLASSTLWARVRAGVSARARVERGLAVIAFTLACLSKETACALPAVLLAWDACGAGTGGGAGGGWLKRNGPWLLGWGAALTIVGLLRLHFDIPVGGRGAGGVATLERITARAAEYARLLVVPWPLNSWYTASQVRLTALNAACSLALLAAAVLTAGPGRGRSGIAGLAWTVGFLVPALGLLGSHGAEIAERFLYIPSVGCAVLVAGLWALAEGRPSRLARWRGFPVAVTAALFAAATVARAGTWKDEETLYLTMSRTSPGTALADHGVGLARAARGDFEGAVARHRLALRKEPTAHYAYAGLGQAQFRLGRLAEAHESFSRAAELMPDSALAHTNLGLTAAALGRFAEAEEQYLRAIALAPRRYEAYYDLGNLRARQGKADEAIAAYRQALAVDPDAADAHFNLARTYALQGRLEESAHHFREVLRLQPDAADAREDLARLLRSGGRTAGGRAEGGTTR